MRYTNIILTVIPLCLLLVATGCGGGGPATPATATPPHLYVGVWSGPIDAPMPVGSPYRERTGTLTLRVTNSGGITGNLTWPTAFYPPSNWQITSGNIDETGRATLDCEGRNGNWEAYPPAMGLSFGPVVTSISTATTTTTIEGEGRMRWYGSDLPATCKLTKRNAQ